MAFEKEQTLALLDVSRGEMGFWHLLGEISATVNVSEISRRVSACTAIFWKRAAKKVR